MLTHHPEDTTPPTASRSSTAARAEAVRIGLEAAGGKNLEVFSPTIGRQLLELGLIDEIDLHIAPVLLGQGIRPYDNPGSAPIRLHRVGEGDPPRRSTYGTDPPQRRRSRPEPGTTCQQLAVGASFSHRAQGGGIWPDGAGMPDPQPQAPHQPTLAPEPTPGRRGDRWPTSLALPLAPGGLACHGVHRPPGPRAGQTARPGNSKGAIHGSAVDLASLALQPTQPRVTASRDGRLLLAVLLAGAPSMAPGRRSVTRCRAPGACPPWSPP